MPPRSSCHPALSFLIRGDRPYHCNTRLIEKRYFKASIGLSAGKAYWCALSECGRHLNKKGEEGNQQVKRSFVSFLDWLLTLLQLESVCAWHRGASLPCQVHWLHGNMLVSNLRTNFLVSLLSVSWWGIAPPPATHVMALLWEAPRSATSLLRFSRGLCSSVPDQLLFDRWKQSYV